MCDALGGLPLTVGSLSLEQPVRVNVTTGMESTSMNSRRIMNSFLKRMGEGSKGFGYSIVEDNISAIG